MAEQRQPDWSPGDVIAADAEGNILLDDGIWTWNPERAQTFLNEIRGDECDSVCSERGTTFMSYWDTLTEAQKEWRLKNWR